MGTLFHTIVRETGSELQLMQQLGYDAITFGNHDFDYYPDGLAQSIRSAIKQVGKLPPIIASNLEFSQSDSMDDDLQALWNEGVIKPYVVLRKAGLKIGVFGMLGYKASDVAANAKPLTFRDPIITAKKMVKLLKQQEKVDLVILMSHGGILADDSSPLGWRGDDIDLITQVKGIDIIVGGHSHTPLYQPINQQGRLVLQAGSEMRFIGELGFDVRQGQITDYHYQLHPINDSLAGDPKVIQMVEHFKQQVGDLYLHAKGYDFDQPLAQIAQDLSRTYD
ncbi:MAG: metallophosphoesterase, partial [Enterobacterales bacterium]|nr:metallophosphoesterase [Enterobacterales bacterium]